MKKIITIFNVLIVSFFSFNINILATKEVVFRENENTNSQNYIAYNEIIIDEIIEEKQEEIVEGKTTIEVKNEEVKANVDVKEHIIEKVQQEEIKENSNNDRLEILKGSMSGYGPDCYGCTSNRVASGYYVGEGNIYYEDKTYGKVRIVAGDKKYPLGTIVKIGSNNISSKPIIAIVLDRGGDIGINKKFTFDLLFATEKEASKYGVSRNINFEILRLGY